MTTSGNATKIGIRVKTHYGDPFWALSLEENRKKKNYHLQLFSSCKRHLLLKFALLH
jgi:hypothetical protein